MTRFRFLPVCVFALLSLCSASLFAREETYRGLSDLAKALSIIEKNYVDEVSSERLVRSAIRGMFDSLDPYSAYLSPDSLRNLEIGTMGEFEGVGIEITVRDGLLTVISPIEGSPAEEAGMKPGDVIVSIDGRGMDKTNVVEALGLIRGRAGTRITLSVRREGEDEVRDFAIVRRMIRLGLPDRRQMQLFHAVHEAQQTAIDAIRPGVELRTIDRRARQVLRKSKVDGKRLDELFVHSTGHGVGLEIHESPRLAPKQRKRLRAGMVVTVEPGVYLQGAAGVRIEDVVAVTPSGCEVLTPTPRELRVIE